MTLQRKIRLTQLRLLVSIADYGSLAQAALFLHVTQPAATKTLHQLESAIGEKLVTRGSAGSALTPAGWMLCRRARTILTELSDAEQELGLWHSGGAGHVIIGALPVATPLLIPELLKDLSLIAPRVTVEVLEGNSDSMFKELVANKIDLLVGRVWPGSEPGVMTDVLYESTFRLNVRSGHPLTERKRIKLKDTVGFPWILPPPSAHTRGALEDMLRHNGLNVPAHPVETTSYLVTRSLLLGTDSVAAMPVEVFATEKAQGLIVNLSVKLDLRLPPVGVVRNTRRTVSPAVLTVVEQLKKIALKISSCESLSEPTLVS